MCGRFTNRYTWRELHDLYRATEPWIGPASNLQPRYNIAPMQRIVAIREETGARHPFMAQWGLMPFWPKDGKWKLSTFNATIERLRETEAEGARPGTFGRAWRAGRRCIIPANGYYEWPQPKKPRYFTLKGDAVFAFAGLWDICRKPDGEELVSCTFVTVPPNDYTAQFHDRMPVLLRSHEFHLWLGEAPPADAARLCMPYAGEDLISWPVAAAVGNWRNEGPGLIEPVGEN